MSAETSMTKLYIFPEFTVDDIYACMMFRKLYRRNRKVPFCGLLLGWLLFSFALASIFAIFTLKMDILQIITNNSL